MHQHWWDDAEARKAREREKQAERRRQNKAAMEEMNRKQIDAIRLQAVIVPEGFEADERKTSETAINLVNVCLDDWRYLSGEVDGLVREAQELHHSEDGGEFDF